MVRSFSVEQPCWSPLQVHLQVFLRTFLRLLLEKGTPQQTLFLQFFKILKKLATLKVAVCRPVIYCKGTRIQSSSWTPIEIFETSLRNLVGSLCCNPQTVSLNSSQKGVSGNLQKNCFFAHNNGVYARALQNAGILLFL